MTVKAGFQRIIGLLVLLLAGSVQAGVDPVPGVFFVTDGWVDTHGHNLATYGFGGRYVYGESNAQATDIEVDLQWCDGREHGIGSDDENSLIKKFANSLAGMVEPQSFGDRGRHTEARSGYREEQEFFNIISGEIETLSERRWTQWPVWWNVSHQTIHPDWLRASFDDWKQDPNPTGVFNQNQKVFISSLESFRGLCGFLDPNWPSAKSAADELECDDDYNLDRQIDMAWEMSYRDSSGGLNSSGYDWMQVVTNVSEARHAIAEGRLAVVLHLEATEIMQSGLDDTELSFEAIDDYYFYYHAKGVRSFQPVHETNNQFGGIGVFAETGILANLLALDDHRREMGPNQTETDLVVDGYFTAINVGLTNWVFNMLNKHNPFLPTFENPYEDNLCMPFPWMDECWKYSIDATDPTGLTEGLFDDYTTPEEGSYSTDGGNAWGAEYGGGFNDLGLTLRGEYLTRAAMCDSVLVDVAHGSQMLFEQVNLASMSAYSQSYGEEDRHRYPLFHSHARVRDIQTKKTEYNSSLDTLSEIDASGGMAGIRTGVDLVYDSDTAVSNDCHGSSKTFAQMYYSMVDNDLSVAVATDTPSAVPQLRPRFYDEDSDYVRDNDYPLLVANVLKLRPNMPSAPIPFPYAEMVVPKDTIAWACGIDHRDKATLRYYQVWLKSLPWKIDSREQIGTLLPENGLGEEIPCFTTLFELFYSPHPLHPENWACGEGHEEWEIENPTSALPGVNLLGRLSQQEVQDASTRVGSDYDITGLGRYELLDDAMIDLENMSQRVEVMKNESAPDFLKMWDRAEQVNFDGRNEVFEQFCQTTTSGSDLDIVAPTGLFSDPVPDRQRLILLADASQHLSNFEAYLDEEFDQAREDWGTDGSGYPNHVWTDLVAANPFSSGREVPENLTYDAFSDSSPLLDIGDCMDGGLCVGWVSDAGQLPADFFRDRIESDDPWSTPFSAAEIDYFNSENFQPFLRSGSCETAEVSRLLIRGNGEADDLAGLKLTARFLLDANPADSEAGELLGFLDPVDRGANLRVVDSAGATILDFVTPLAVATEGASWSGNSAGTSLRFQVVDPGAVVDFKLKLKPDLETDEIAVRADLIMPDQDIALDSSQFPLTMTVALDNVLPAGRCGETTIALNDDTEGALLCELDSGGSLSCHR